MHLVVSVRLSVPSHSWKVIISSRCLSVCRLIGRMRSIGFWFMMSLPEPPSGAEFRLTQSDQPTVAGTILLSAIGPLSDAIFSANPGCFVGSTSQTISVTPPTSAQTTCYQHVSPIVQTWAQQLVFQFIKDNKQIYHIIRNKRMTIITSDCYKISARGPVLSVCLIVSDILCKLCIIKCTKNWWSKIVFLKLVPPQVVCSRGHLWHVRELVCPICQAHWDPVMFMCLDFSATRWTVHPLEFTFKSLPGNLSG